VENLSEGHSLPIGSTNGRSLRRRRSVDRRELASTLWPSVEATVYKPVADLFDMQDEIIARLANTLNTHLVAAEARRADRATDPDAMDLYFQGMAFCPDQAPKRAQRGPALRSSWRLPYPDLSNPARLAKTGCASGKPLLRNRKRKAVRCRT
jgi:ferredoxin